MNNSEKQRRTFIVILITIFTMFLEIGVGYFSHSMALLADGCHMGTHALALGITFFTYFFLQKYKDSSLFSWGPGKLSSLSGFASAILLGFTGIAVGWESIERFIHPVDIFFDDALIVAILGLIVNGISAYIMKDHHHHHENAAHRDVNFQSAYLHIIADALTSVLAIVALIIGKYFRISCLDPLVGLLGSVVIINWSVGLLRESGSILLDRENLAMQKRLSELFNGHLQFQSIHIWKNSENDFICVASVVLFQSITLEEIKNKIRDTGHFDAIFIEIAQQD